MNPKEFRDDVRRRRDELIKREDDILNKIPTCFGEGGLHNCSSCDSNIKVECIKSRKRGRIDPEILHRPFTI
jgi:hypothetical protein